MNHRIIIHIWIFLLISCDFEMKTELDLHTISSPPKLAVSATLDGGSGIFRILLAEGNALADYAEPQSRDKEIIRNGEIRLFEDNILILSEPGPFDMSYISDHHIQNDDGRYDVVHSKIGCRFEKTEIFTRVGSIYRLEVEVDGYETVTSSMVMPAAPVVSASMDTTILEHMTLIYNRGGYYYNGYDIRNDLKDNALTYPFQMDFWSISVHLVDPDPNERNYFALEFQDNQHFSQHNEKFIASIISVADISILQDNPTIEVKEGRPHADFYSFTGPLLISDITFSGKNTSLKFYLGIEPEFFPENWENMEFVKNITHHTLTFYVKSIPPETFKYFRKQLLQQAGVGFYTEPVVIESNIINGYGYFSVFNSVSFQFLEYETEQYAWRYR